MAAKRKKTTQQKLLEEERKIEKAENNQDEQTDHQNQKGLCLFFHSGRRLVIKCFSPVLIHHFIYGIYLSLMMGTS